MRAITGTGLTSTTDLDIHIRDENDSKPSFTKGEYYAEIPEGSPPGTTVLQVHATDLDSGSAGAVSYRLIGSEAFHIDPLSGEITVDKPTLLDRELQPGVYSTAYQLSRMHICYGLLVYADVHAYMRTASYAFPLPSRQKS